MVGLTAVTVADPYARVEGTFAPFDSVKALESMVSVPVVLPEIVKVPVPLVNVTVPVLNVPVPAANATLTVPL